VTVAAHGTLIEIRVTGNAFLKRMVRSLVAVLLEVGRGRLTTDEVEAILVRRERALHGRAVPALGLTLERVIYQGRNR
jgi:tRNA pseudouridine38-40 synthase